MAFVFVLSLFFNLENVCNPKLGVVMEVFCVVTASCASGALHTRHTRDVFYHHASLQLKNRRAFSDSEPAIGYCLLTFLLVICLTKKL
jgi:hypothetical protein